MTGHEYFERLGVMATLGRLSIEDLEEMKTHIRECDSCKERYDEYAMTTRQQFPVSPSLGLGKSAETKLHAFEAGFRRDFLARAKAEGIRFSPEVKRWPPSSIRPLARLLPVRLAVSLAFVLLMVTGIVAYRRSKSLIGKQQSSISGLTGEVSELAHTGLKLRKRLAEEIQYRSSLESTINDTRKERDLAAARVHVLEQQLASAQGNTDALRSRLAESAARTSQLQRRIQTDTEGAEKLSAEVRNLRAANQRLAATAAGRNDQDEHLSAQLQEQKTVSARYKQLLLAGRDITNLMGARNLRVIDVFDAEGNGDNAKIFGRVFYTQGESLVFYAFDLGNRGGNADNVSYVGWGKKAGGDTTRELGIFYVDNAAQRRWVLRFDNPSVLRKIDAVFVTVEPSGTRKRPTGQTLLYAYLRTPINHP